MSTVIYKLFVSNLLRRKQSQKTIFSTLSDSLGGTKLLQGFTQVEFFSYTVWLLKKLFWTDNIINKTHLKTLTKD